MVDYHVITSCLIVKPVAAEIGDRMQTSVELVDEGAGMFVRVHQCGAEEGKSGLEIDLAEWPLIRAAIGRLVRVARRLDAVV